MEAEVKPSGTSESKKSVQSLVGVILFAVMILLTVISLYTQNQILANISESNRQMVKASDEQLSLYRTYVLRYKESQTQLDITRQDLKESQDSLKQTEVMLSESKRINEDLKTQLASLQTAPGTGAGTSTATAKLVEQNVKVASTLQGLRAALDGFRGQVADLEDGSSLIKLMREKITEIRVQMQQIRHQADLDRIAAQKEQDRLRLLNGNRGFLVKDGKHVGSSLKHVARYDSGKPVGIDVSFYE